MDTSRRIENWAIVSSSFQMKAPDAIGHTYLYGQVFSEHYDGQECLTSPLTSINLPDRMAFTLNSAYVLGQPSEEYIRQYGDKIRDVDWNDITHLLKPADRTQLAI